MQEVILACDPGASGGFACLTKSIDGPTITLESMPKSLTEIVQFLLMKKLSIAELWIEDIPKFCGKAIPSSTTAVLFDNYGIIKGAAAALGYAIHRVPPKEWQEPLGLGGRKSCATQPEWKRKLKNKAQEMYPHLDVTLQNCDALLLLHYARQQTRR
jgi:hypothetical protein